LVNRTKLYLSPKSSPIQFLQECNADANSPNNDLLR